MHICIHNGDNEQVKILVHMLLFRLTHMQWHTFHICYIYLLTKATFNQENISAAISLEITGIVTKTWLRRNGASWTKEVETACIITSTLARCCKIQIHQANHRGLAILSKVYYCSPQICLAEYIFHNIPSHITPAGVIHSVLSELTPDPLSIHCRRFDSAPAQFTSCTCSLPPPSPKSTAKETMEKLRKTTPNLLPSTFET